MFSCQNLTKNFECCGITFAVMFGICLACWKPSSLLAAPPNQVADSPDNQVLMVEGNRLIYGRVSEMGDVYHVEQPTGGILVISKETVVFTGRSLSEVYLYLQGQLPRKPTVQQHLDLARWWLTQKLWSEARLELVNALEIDPRREDVRQQLGKLDLLIRRGPEMESSTTKPRRTLEELAARALEESESLAGLSREAGQVFTTKIQPLLLNRCANAGCHSPQSPQQFHLQAVRVGNRAHQQITEKNLLAVLEFVDRDNPRQSPLLTTLSNSKGSHGKALFSGRRGEEQLQLIREWVLSLKEEEVGSHKSAGNDSVLPKTVREKQPDPFAGIEEPPIKSLTKTSPRNITPRSDSIEPEETTAPILSTEKERDLLPGLPPEDPFDPGEFNRHIRAKRGPQK